MALLRCIGGKKFDITTLPAGYAAYCQSYKSSSSTISDLFKISECVSAPAGEVIVANGNCILFLVNAEGYNTLTAKGNTDPNNAIVFGLNDDGTLECIYAERITTSNTHTIATQGYKYLMVTLNSPYNVNVNVQLSNS